MVAARPRRRGAAGRRRRRDALQRTCRAALFVFLLAAIAIVAGLVGLGLHYRKERKQQHGGRGGAGVAAARSPPGRLPDRDAADGSPGAGGGDAEAAGRGQSLGAGHGRSSTTTTTQAEELLQAGDLIGAFREYCRAMLPLSRALEQASQEGRGFPAHLGQESRRPAPQDRPGILRAESLSYQPEARAKG